MSRSSGCKCSVEEWLVVSSTLARFKIHTDGFSDHFKDAIWDLSVMVIVNMRGVQKSEGNPQPKTEHNMVFQEPVWIVGLNQFLSPRI